MTYDAGDAKQVKTKKTAAQLNMEERREEFRKLVASKEARKLIWSLLEYCRVFHTFGELDSHSMAIASGRRDVGLWMLDKVLAVDPSLLKQMKDEN